MDSLRWILLAIGVAVIAGIYIWSRQGSRNRVEPRFSQQDYDEHPVSDEEQWDVRPVEREQYREPVQEELLDQVDLKLSVETEPLEIDPGLEAQLKGLEQALVQKDGKLRATEKTSTAQSHATSPTIDEKIIAFFLVAPKGTLFTGGDVSNAFASQGLQFGNMNIFHRIPEGSKTDPVFSVANLVEPGTFEPEIMDASNTPGLSLFMRLPGPNEPLRAFDDLATTAMALADQLHGELRDDTRSLVTNQTLETLRADVADFERRLHLPASS